VIIEDVNCSMVDLLIKIIVG